MLKSIRYNDLHPYSQHKGLILHWIQDNQCCISYFKQKVIIDHTDSEREGPSYIRYTYDEDSPTFHQLIKNPIREVHYSSKVEEIKPTPTGAQLLDYMPMYMEHIQSDLLTYLRNAFVRYTNGSMYTSDESRVLGQDSHQVYVKMKRPLWDLPDDSKIILGLDFEKSSFILRIGYMDLAFNFDSDKSMGEVFEKAHRSVLNYLMGYMR